VTSPPEKNVFTKSFPAGLPADTEGSIIGVENVSPCSPFSGQGDEFFPFDRASPNIFPAAPVFQVTHVGGL